MPAWDGTSHLAGVSWREKIGRGILVMEEMLEWKTDNLWLAKNRVEEV